MSKIDIEFEENSLHQEGIISEFYQRHDKSSHWGKFPFLPNLECFKRIFSLIFSMINHVFRNQKI